MIVKQSILYLVLLALCVGGLFIGAADLTPVEVWNGLFDPGASSAGVVRGIRLPRILGGALVGAALGIGGVGLQSIHRNRLAEPYLLGISSGGGLGLVIGTLVTTSISLPLVPAATATAAATAVSLFSRRLGLFSRSTDGLILAGVALNFVFLAWTLIMIFALDSPRLPTFVYFVFGSLGTVTWESLWVALPLVLAAVFLLGSRRRQLDVVALGDDEAVSVGVDVPRLATVALIAVGLATGSSVAMAGVVGFVGLLGPTVARRAFGPTHRILLPSAAAVGAVFVLAADMLIRVIFGNIEVPLGVVTAAIGGPVLALALVGRRTT